jgi:WS/DGAT/MGAT family acyltransferase
METRRLNPLDASWLLVESRDTPMHIAGLMPFVLPEDAPSDFLQRLMSDLRGSEEFVAPWNYRLQMPGLRHLMPGWVEEPIDLEYHVRHSALPRPGGERELGQLVARLHSQPLDLSRPPWEFHLIEGLQGNRFAIYVKMHHSLLDGISGVRLLMRSMSEDPKASLKLPPFWGRVPGKRGKQESPSAAKPPSLDGVLDTLRAGLGNQMRSAPQLVRGFSAMLESARNRRDALQVPFDAPKSSLNGRVRGQRRVATQQFEISRLKVLAKAAECTLNDVVLAICGGALRRFLLDDGTLPGKPLTAGVPVSVRPADDQGSGNAITFIIASMGTEIDDPLARLDAIVASTRRAKEHVQGLPRDAMTQYTMVLMAPSMLSMLTPLGGRVRPMFNVTVSNVPGPDKPLYFRGARLEAIYPISLISHGMALNITCESYVDTLNFAFVGCRDAIPHLQNLAVYSSEAFEELEKAVATRARPQRKAPRKAARKAAPGGDATGAEDAVGDAVGGKQRKSRKAVAEKSSEAGTKGGTKAGTKAASRRPRRAAGA